MRVPKAKDSNYPIKAACLGFCTLKGQTPLPVSMIISTTCPTPVVWVGKQLVYLVKPQMSSYYGFFSTLPGIILQNGWEVCLFSWHDTDVFV